MKKINFSIIKKLENDLGRAGVISTPHGDINTPSFVTVGTKATVKALTPEMLLDIGIQVVLANTYHLYLEPGDEIVKSFGGFTKFMNWNGPSMTDSGGFQVFSLGAAYGKELSKVVQIKDPSLLITERSRDEGVEPLASIGNDGVSFKSHLDGTLHYITPEKSIEIQHNLGADIIFTFDECTSPAENYEYQKESLLRTHTWAKRSLKRHTELESEKDDTIPKQALFGIIQGGRHEDLRKESAREISSMGFDGFGIGGSFAKEDMSTAVKWVNEILPEDKPRHLLGIGEPNDLFMGVRNGVDLFDCVAPTRNARNGSLYTKNGKINMMNAKYRTDHTSIDVGCLCYTCKNFTKGYLAHLFRSKEMLAGTLGSIHNLYFINKLVSDMRQSILSGNFDEFENKFMSDFNSN
jgi:queuine tRNA-ribosyltransferase